ncbi:hypothetical protein ROJ8625_02676 [Roseivivax jejudonensis]|uniref:Tyrosine specific protein phosphatases domain-containing protein n=1 Tax=Roseivivax jejudonensis TaxID=1529041 RepID=A0A1X6ZIL9_9RHOB|nr:hypothetical protein ROJ8625_02676 [Roseivivax jejudonensis]
MTEHDPQVHRTGGVIHALPVGGGILAIAPQPGAHDSYDKDLGHILDWRPALVVSLTTTDELAQTGAGDLGPQLQERATRWAHVPVAPDAAPTPDVAKRWTETSAFARRALWGGGRVLIHGRDGCGRAGMAALRLMIEAGEAPDEAQQRLWALHRPMIGGTAQLRWAMAAEREAAVFLSRRADATRRPAHGVGVRGWKTTQAGLVTAASFRT